MSYLEIKPQHSQVIYIDESGFSLSIRRSFGRSLIGSRANLNVPQIRSKNITLLAAMNSNGILSLKLQEGATNGEVFSRFLQQLFDQLSNVGVLNALLIMDNVRFHKTDLILNQINESGHSVLFLPPYSPFLNPIEEVFHQMKSIVRNAKPTNKDELFTSILNTPNYISPQQCSNYCNHSKTYFSRCLGLETIEN